MSEMETIDGEAVEAVETGGELAVREPAATPDEIRSAILSYTDEQKALIRRTLMPDTSTDDELALFLAYSQRVGLDPVARQIHATKRNGKLVIQTAIDGFRLIAARTGRYGGQTAPEWCGADEVWKDVWLKEAHPLAARVGVYRAGFAEPLVRVALWSEFGPANLNDKSAFMWKKMPALMLAKTAEAQALRAAFPAELSGVYTDDEMTQADGPMPSRVEAQTEHRVEDAGRPKVPPKSWAEWADRFSALVGGGESGKAEAVEWRRQALDVEFSVQAIADLPRDLVPAASVLLSSVLLILEDREGDLAFDPEQRDVIARAFAERLEGKLLAGPPWRLGPGEEDRSTYEAYAGKPQEAAQDVASDNPAVDTSGPVDDGTEA